MKLRRSADQTQPDPRAAAAQQAALRQLAAANVAPANQAAPTPKTSFAFIKDAEGNRYKIELVMPEGVKTLGFKADKQQWDQLGKSIFDAGLKAHLQDGPNVIEANAANGLCRINALDVEVHQAPEFVYNCWNIIDRSADEDRFYHQPVQNNNAPVNAQDNPADAAEAAGRDAALQASGNIAQPAQALGIPAYNTAAAQFADNSIPISEESHVATLQGINVLNGENVCVVSPKGKAFKLRGSGPHTLDHLLKQNEGKKFDQMIVIPVIENGCHALLIDHKGKFYYYDPLGSGSNPKMEAIKGPRKIEYAKGQPHCANPNQTSVYCASFLEYLCKLDNSNRDSFFSHSINLDEPSLQLPKDGAAKRKQLEEQSRTYPEKLQATTANFVAARAKAKTNMDVAKGLKYPAAQKALDAYRPYNPGKVPSLNPTGIKTPPIMDLIQSSSPLDAILNDRKDNKTIIGTRKSNLEQTLRLRTPLALADNETCYAPNLPILRDGEENYFRLRNKNIPQIDCVMTKEEGAIGVESVRNQLRIALSQHVAGSRNIYFDLTDRLSTHNNAEIQTILAPYYVVLNEDEFKGQAQSVTFIYNPTIPPAPPEDQARRLSSHAQSSPALSSPQSVAAASHYPTLTPPPPHYGQSTGSAPRERTSLLGRYFSQTEHEFASPPDQTSPHFRQPFAAASSAPPQQPIRQPIAQATPQLRTTLQSRYVNQMDLEDESQLDHQTPPNSRHPLPAVAQVANQHLGNRPARQIEHSPMQSHGLIIGQSPIPVTGTAAASSSSPKPETGLSDEKFIESLDARMKNLDNLPNFLLLSEIESNVEKTLKIPDTSGLKKLAEKRAELSSLLRIASLTRERNDILDDDKDKLTVIISKIRNAYKITFNIIIPEFQNELSKLNAGKRAGTVDGSQIRKSLVELTSYFNRLTNDAKLLQEKNYLTFTEGQLGNLTILRNGIKELKPSPKK